MTRRPVIGGLGMTGLPQGLPERRSLPLKLTRTGLPPSTVVVRSRLKKRVDSRLSVSTGTTCAHEPVGELCEPDTCHTADHTGLQGWGYGRISAVTQRHSSKVRKYW